MKYCSVERVADVCKERKADCTVIVLLKVFECYVLLTLFETSSITMAITLILHHVSFVSWCSLYFHESAGNEEIV